MAHLIPWFILICFCIILSIIRHFRDKKDIYYKLRNDSMHNNAEMTSTIANIHKTTTKVTPAYSQHISYSVFHRKRDNFTDNMNYQLYKCKGLYIQTNRKRTVKLEAFQPDDVVVQMKKFGFTEPFEINRIAFPEITTRQLSALRNVNVYDTSDVCLFDASAILSKKYDHDSTPNPELVSYATSCHIKFSYYIGKKALYDLIFENLDLRNKITFFLFCVYRYITNDRKGDLSKHPYRNLFYTFSSDNLSNERFIKSMNKYRGRDLRFFGTLTVNNSTLYGGSKNTISYKTALDFLKQHFSIRDVTNKRI